jgi:hypothetical protein
VAKRSAPVQIGSEAHPASYTIGTGSFVGLEWPGCGVDHSTISSADVKERVEIYLYAPSGLLWPVIGRILFVFCSSYTVNFSSKLMVSILATTIFIKLMVSMLTARTLSTVST